jgi:hypothetical protein
MFYVLLALILSTAGALGTSDPPTLSAGEIMARVAANQDRAVKLRAEYIYQQHIRVVTHRTNGKLAREEKADYVVTPTPEGTKKELTHIEGRYLKKGECLEFQGKPVPEHDSLDGDMVNDFREDLASDSSKDGFGCDLFPLTTEEQKKYRFDLAGEDAFRGRKVYRVTFRPADKNELAWAGEAVVDAEEFQPITVFTKLSRRIPFFVRTLLGTDLPGIGFNVEYRRFDEGVWFPVSFGTEFRLRAVFFINRDISVSLENSAFERAKVESKIRDFKPIS